MEFTKTKAFKSARARVRAANARFKRMTRRQQRIAVARDVISLLAAGKIRAQSTYFRMSVKMDLLADVALSDDVDLGDMIEAYSRPSDKCHVCGIGSLFLAAVRRNDRLKFVDFLGNRGRHAEVEYLAPWFSPAQLDLVESYYERTYQYSQPITMTGDNDTRLIMIMENIISNGGKFDPHKGKNSTKDKAAMALAVGGSDASKHDRIS